MKRLGIWSSLEAEINNLGVDFACVPTYFIDRLIEVLTKCKKVDIYPVLLVPSEGKVSSPCGYNWKKWAELISIKSMEFSNLKGMIIDDFNSLSMNGIDNIKFWRKHYHLTQLEHVKEILGDLKFYLVVYQWNLFDTINMFKSFLKFYEENSFDFDGLIVPWKNMLTSIGIKKGLRIVRRFFPDRELLGLCYSVPTSWYPIAPFPQIFKRSLDITYEESDSTIIFGYPKGVLFDIVKALESEKV